MFSSIPVLPAVLIHLYTTTAQVFLIQPSPRYMSPAGTQLQLNCSVKEGYVVARWEIQLPDLPEETDPVETDDEEAESHLRERGITFRNVGTPMSQLIFDGDQRNSHSIVKCQARASAFNQTISNLTEVIIYGVPPVPTNLTATENGLGSLNISWSFAFIEGVPVDFILTVMNLNASSAEQTVRTQDQHYIFTTGDHMSCDSYSFSVVAENIVGSSNSSEAVTASVPSLPPSPIVEHSLSKMDGVFLLTISLNNLEVCPDYPVINYVVVLEDCRSIQKSHIHISNQSTIEFNDLVENQCYTYHVTAANQFGNGTESTPTKITTTDVQNVSIHLMENSTYFIQCEYVDGSDARGCVYTIVGDDVMGNVTGYITREDSSAATVDLADITCYSEMLVYDWESDGTFGTLPVVNITFPDEMMCMAPIATTTTDLNPKIAITIGVLVGVLVGVGVVTAIVVIVIIVLKMGYCKTSVHITEEEAGATNGEEGDSLYSVDSKKAGSQRAAKAKEAYHVLENTSEAQPKTSDVEDEEAPPPTQPNCSVEGDSPCKLSSTL